MQTPASIHWSFASTSMKVQTRENDENANKSGGGGDDVDNDKYAEESDGLVHLFNS